MKLILAIVTLFFPISLLAQVSITIKGRTTETTGKQLYFYDYTQMRPIAFDSCAVNNDGSFSKVFNVAKPGIYLGGFDEIETFTFWADNENLEMSLVRGMPAKITGGKNAELVNSINQLLGEYAKQQSSREPNINRTKILEEHKAKLRNLIVTNAQLPAVIYALRMMDIERESDFLKEIGEVLVKANPNNLAVSNFIVDLTRLNTGKPATEIEFLDTNGKQTSLIKKLGEAKYTLVDVWGTYCIPCREGIPGIKRLYAQYKSKGFDVLAISLDTKNDTWMKSLAEEQMPWDQGRTTDGGGKLRADYRFNSIPYLALFDQQGKIIALGLQHEDLEKKLEELMGKPDPSANLDREIGSNGIKSAEDIALIERIVNATSLTDYTTYFAKLDEKSYKESYFKILRINTDMKDYQISKIGFSLGRPLKQYQQILRAENLSQKQKLEAIREIDKNQIGFLSEVLNREQYRKYLDVRLSGNNSL